MVKHFNVIMAGVISGIVALFTSFLGISGTIIGSVISSFLYQLLSSYSQEKYDEYDERGDKGSRSISIQKPNLASEVVYVFPIVVIILIELLFVLTGLHYSFANVFNFLELATANNLFRVMGIALIVLGIYPLLDSNDIDKKNGYVLFVIGLLVFLRGIGDLTSIFYLLYDKVIRIVDPIFALFVVVVLAIVVINVLRVSINKSGGLKNMESKARKIDTDLPEDNYFHDKFNRNPREYPKGNINSNYHEDVYEVQSNYHDDGYGLQSDYYGENLEDLPVYEEDYIYMENPNDPNNPIRRKILKKVKPASHDDVYYDDVLEQYPKANRGKTFNSNTDDLEYSSRKRFRRN